MIVYVYKNNFCDPANNTGTARKFSSSVDVDDFISLFVASISPRFLSNYRILITNDDVSFSEVDHFVLFNESLIIGSPGRIREVDINTVAMEVNDKLKAQEKRREEARRLAKEQVEKRKAETSSPE